MSIFMEEEVWSDYSLYDREIYEDDLDWKYTLLPLPSVEFLTNFNDYEYSQQENFVFDSPKSAKYKIRYHDCMWSGRCVKHQTKNGYACCNCPVRCCFGINNTNQARIQQNTNIVFQKTTTTNVTPTTDQQQPEQQQKSNQAKILSQQHIPPGTSLLLNSRINQQQQRRQTNRIKIPSVMTSDFLKERETIGLSVPARPDTPLSLDDDTPEFKHTIDLSACTMGSNRMTLETVSEAKIINLLKEHLEETSTDSLRANKTGITQIMSGHKSESLTDVLNIIKTFPDFEEMDEDNSSILDMDSSDSESSGNNTSVSVTSNSTSLRYNSGHSTITHSDHSYTRSKNGLDVIGLGVQTPSDSEEEIDVVSVGDKTLPTNPSAKDRRALQTTVAHKISVGIVKTAKGVKTIPPRRRCSEEPYSITNIVGSPNKPTVSTFDKCLSSSEASPSTSYLTATSTNSTTSSTYGKYSSSIRKRYLSSRNEHRSSSSKRHRGRKQRTPASNKRQASDSEELETIEKRNLHNDMERQRRIGLKNLFEELKKEIPSLKDKERAPKVNILREAASLCHRLNRENEEVSKLKQHQEKLLARLKELRTTSATRRDKNNV